MKVGFTGTQKGMSPRQYKAIVGYFRMHQDVTEFHHGDCIGADAQAHSVAADMGVPMIVIHPPANNQKRAYCKPSKCKVGIQQGGGVNVSSIVITLPERDYRDRNHDIVDESDVLLACPFDKEESQPRSGTWATIRYARQIGKKVLVIQP